MVKSRYGYRTQIPSISSAKAQTKSLSFKDGISTFKDNDDLKLTEVVQATDARFVNIGRYKTRKGLDRYTTPVGAALNVQQASTTGASDIAVGGLVGVAEKLTITTGGRITRVDVRLKTLDDSQGVLLVEVYENDGGMPGDLLCRSSIQPAAITGTYAYLPVHFVEAPLVATSDAIIVAVRSQNASGGTYAISSTTNTSNGLATIDGGAIWYTNAFSYNVKVYTATNTAVKGVTRAYRPNGTKQTQFAYDNSIASVNDGTGAITVLKSDFVAGATHYRARMVQDALYWVNGVEKPWKYDFTSWTQITAAPYTPSLIEEHKGLLFFNDVDDKTRIFYSNFALYDTYTSTDFIYVPAPKSYDAITALAKLNGVLYVFANRNKFQLYGADNDTFSLDEASSQRGTFSQESVVYDSNYIYHADEEGIWQFNGTGEKNLALPFLEDYLDIPDKSSIVLDISQNRLYCFYTPVGASDNSECFVMNLQLDVFESVDLNTPIGRTFGRYAQDNIFIQASNRVAALYYGELSTNDYSNLGDQMQFEIRTPYRHFDRPGEYKTVPKWRPQFPSQIGEYSIQAGYDIDYREDPDFNDKSVSGSGPRLNTGVLLNTGARLASQQMIAPTDMSIRTNFRRLQLRYKHIAAREPVEVDSEILAIEIQRMI